MFYINKQNRLKARTIPSFLYTCRKNLNVT
nr:MAG TPA: hypothetical protein [Caudoviricetes sp.]